LLQLLRGAGPAGLSAMPEKTQLGEGWHVRPLLDFTREEMASYATDNNLNWIDDDSNDDVRFDRNYLRQMVMPSLKQRWPGVLKTLSRAAGIQSNVNELIEDLAARDLSFCIKPENNTLNAHHLGALSSARAVTVIRYWLKMHQYRSPGAKVLEQILSDIVNSQSDTSPCIRWGDVEIRRYRDMVFLTRGLPTVSDDAKLISWNISHECELEFGKLKADIITGQGIAYNKITGSRINIRYRTGHEQIKLGGHHHTLKNVFQEKGIPPCFRAIIPLIYIDNRLVEITGLCIDEDFTAGPDEESLFISWDRADEIYAMQY
jgi:tRNA(Ile)-lysidine synthase